MNFFHIIVISMFNLMNLFCAVALIAIMIEKISLILDTFFMIISFNSL